MGPRRISAPLFALALTVALAAGMTASLVLGTTPTTPGEAWQAVIDRVSGLAAVSPEARVVTEIRAPRAVLAALIGASLALVGAVLQAMVRNPLADPTILGGSSGAGLGAVCVLLFGIGGAAGFVSLVAGAFVGAGAGFAATFALAWHTGGLTPLRLVLSGIAVSYLAQALTSLVMVRAGDDRKLRSAVFWQLGSVAQARWSMLLGPVLLLAGGVLALWWRGRRLDGLAFGDQTAASLGVDAGRMRAELFVLAAVLTGGSVAVAGGVGFIALVIPHAVRLLVGPLHRRLLPLAVLAGATFGVCADIVARMVAPPSEVPLGVVTALIGAPVFALLVRYKLTEAVT
jgi:iron complex transport system permease protein